MAASRKSKMNFNQSLQKMAQMIPFNVLVQPSIVSIHPVEPIILLNRNSIHWKKTPDVYKESTRCEEISFMEGPLLCSLEELSQKMRETVLAIENEAVRQNTQSHIILGILVVLCALMTIGVVYICITKGLAFLTRESA